MTFHRAISGRNVTSSSPIARTISSLATHQKEVQEISNRVKIFYEHQAKFRIQHGSTNSTRSTKKRGNVVDTSNLSNVLEVNEAKKTALVEPNVPMDRLVEATLKYGLVPPVVMEFPGITVGGGYSGTSGESSSFKHGFFNQTINLVEMVLADGEIVTCSNHERPDLFYGAAGAVGSLGVTTLVELQLQQAKRFVETTYHPISSVSEAVRVIQEKTKDTSLDFVDGILYSLNKGAIITGRCIDSPAPSASTQHFSRPWDLWFYLHVQEIVKSPTAKTYSEAIPLADYLFRYDRGGFWVGACAFQYFHFPFNRLTRWFLDDFLHTRMMYTALHTSGQSNKIVVQDLALPYSNAEEFVQYTQKNFDIWPLWLCPLLTGSPPTFHPLEMPSTGLSPQIASAGPEPAPPQNQHKQGAMLNIGLWGYPSTSKLDQIKALNIDLEHTLQRLGGKKWLYAQTFYTEPEFWSKIYPFKEWYDSLRRKYKADKNLPSVYEKVGPVPSDVGTGEKKSLLDNLLAIWPFGGFWGIWKAIRSGTYRDARRSKWKTMDFGKMHMRAEERKDM